MVYFKENYILFQGSRGCPPSNFFQGGGGGGPNVIFYGDL